MTEYQDRYHPRVKRDLRKLDKSVKIKIRDYHIQKILETPYDSDELTGKLSGICSYHFTQGKVQYRISYLIDDTEKIVYFLMIGKRESFYEILNRRL